MLPLPWALPFVAMLLAIAVGPLWASQWWESHRNKLVVSLGLGFPVFVFYLGRHPGALLHTAEEYVSFMILRAGLYVISGGLRLTG
ncbi:MAG: sodium:proton antiporter, partial [Candidatus Rokuibacteriota bacterium]